MEAVSVPVGLHEGGVSQGVMVFSAEKLDIHRLLSTGSAIDSDLK
jgi:hypothetical protein